MIQVESLSYNYPNGKEVISNLNFSISKGEIFGFLGPSGSGKSTTQKILFRLLNNYRGTAQIAGKEVSQWNSELFNIIGVGFELPNHYLKMTARENLEFFGGFYRKSMNVDALLESVGLLNDAHKKVSEFSKGMKMRLNFIRSFMHDPEILFLDEPTSGLDPVNAKMVKDIIADLRKKGKTIFITTHQMHDADELCDRVAFLSGGKIMAMDSPAQLKLRHSSNMVEVTVSGQSQKHQFPISKLGSNPDFLSLISHQEIETIHSREASLDEVFIKVTGKNLHE
ncbi:MAG: ABC transporter ATP-binding protein [Flavobacteriales bacterium]|nr:ABC transporter ATP-binding protein [Flavobacteriales bacterium]